MPSKRHGYLTRKEWLRERLEDARDKAGAFDVERLLRATRFYYNEFDYSVHVGESTPEDRAQRKSPPVVVTIGPLSACGDPLKMNGLLLPGDADIEIEIPHVDCDCMACRPWTT